MHRGDSSELAKSAVTELGEAQIFRFSECIEKDTIKNDLKVFPINSAGSLGLDRISWSASGSA